MAVQEYSIADTGDEAGAQTFRDRLRSFCAVDLALSSTPRRPLRARLQAYSGRSLRLALLQFSAHSTREGGGRTTSDSRLLVSLHDEGHVVTTQDGRTSTIMPGDLFVIDPSRPFEITTGDIQTRSVYLHRSRLVCLVPQLDQLTALPISGRSGAGAVFRAALQQLFEVAPTMTEDAADGISDALTYLLAPALLGLLGAGDPLPSRLRVMHRQQIRRFVEAHLSDSSLDAATIARGVRLSPRHVYELFSEEPEPLIRWVWRLRLERCHADLASSALAERSIGEIAYSWGFSDVAHFSRSFKLRYGVTPREFRQKAAVRTAEAA